MASALNQLIVTRRKAKGLTQEQLAEQAKLTLRTIQRLENQETQPRMHTLQAVANVLELPWERIQALLASAPIIESETQPSNNQYLQRINLSALAGLIVPFFNIVVPYLLIQKTESKTLQAWQLLYKQIWWSVWTQAALLLTVCYNLTVAYTFNAPLLIHYLIPVLIMKALNALYIYRTHQSLQEARQAVNMT